MVSCSGMEEASLKGAVVHSVNRQFADHQSLWLGLNVTNAGLLTIRKCTYTWTQRDIIQTARVRLNLEYEFCWTFFRPLWHEMPRIKTTLNLSSFLSHVFAFFYNSSHHPVKYAACLFCVSFHRRVLLSRASPRPSLKSGLRSDETLWPRCMWFPWKSQHSKVAEKPFVLLNGCKEWTKCTWASGMKDVRSRFDLFTERPVEGGFFFF